jgi:hypothetical protein
MTAVGIVLACSAALLLLYGLRVAYRARHRRPAHIDSLRDRERLDREAERWTENWLDEVPPRWRAHSRHRTASDMELRAAYPALALVAEKQRERTNE